MPEFQDVTPPVSVPTVPFLSVVVVAHQRKEYLAEALRSIERQTLGRNRFQLVLLKDFEAPELQPQLTRLGATVIDLTPGPLGAWLRRVSGQLCGELIAFLDDDDVFEPEKLARIIEIFRTNGPATYLHHASRPLQPSHRAAHKPPRESPVGHSRVRAIPPATWRREFRPLWFGGAAFNLSSIVVRRRLLDDYPDSLDRVQVSLSAFLFFAALRSDGTILLERAALTRYRREEGFGARGEPAPRAVSRLSALARPRGRDAEVLLEFVKPIQLSDCEIPLRAAMSQSELIRFLEGEGQEKNRILSDLWWVCRSRPWGALVAERAVLLDSFRSLIEPQWGRRSWRHRLGPGSHELT